MMQQEERKACRRIEDAIFQLLDTQEDLTRADWKVNPIDVVLPKMLMRARKRFEKHLKARLLWETPSFTD